MKASDVIFEILFLGGIYYRFFSASEFFFISIQVEVTTTGAVRCLPSLTPCGPVVPAGAALGADLAPPRLPLPVLPSRLRLQGPSMATVWVV